MWSQVQAISQTGEMLWAIYSFGGIKENGCSSGGDSNIIIPAGNKKDLEEIPANIRRKVNFITVEHMDEVLDIALVK